MKGDNYIFPVFEPEGEKEHEAEYKKIHEDYKNLVHIKKSLLIIKHATKAMDMIQ